MNQMIEAVFLSKEIFERRIARERSLMKKADIAACAEAAKRCKAPIS